ncbi:MAG: hypothetical protein OSA99_15035 [Acidimicrobiales bacterium]|nr:hypothetical protein [Acidimicrobiales bacterium]
MSSTIQERARATEQVFRAPACLRDERVRLLLTEARALTMVHIRRADQPSQWAARVRLARASV